MGCVCSRPANAPRRSRPPPSEMDASRHPAVAPSPPRDRTHTAKLSGGYPFFEAYLRPGGARV